MLETNRKSSLIMILMVLVVVNGKIGMILKGNIRVLKKGVLILEK